MNEVAKEELEEKEFFNNAYGKLSGKWKLNPIDWEKIEKTNKATNGYVHSIKVLGDIKGKKVLDYGCGNGALSVVLAKMGANVSGFDISEEAVRVSTTMAEYNGVGNVTNFKVASAYDSGFPDQSFDLIIGQAILHHLGDKETLARELNRLLKPGGKAVFFECFGDSLILERVRLFFPVPTEGEPDWDQQMKYSDINVLKKYFNVQYKEFGMLSRLDRVIKNKSINVALEKVDYFLLKYLKFLRRFARTIVVELSKK